MSDRKISELEELLELNGNETLVVEYGNLNFKVSVNKLKFLLNYIDLEALDLDEVDNTSDLDKPISDAVRLALRGKAATVHTHVIGDVVGLTEILNALEEKVDNGNVGSATVEFIRGTW